MKRRCGSNRCFGKDSTIRLVRRLHLKYARLSVATKRPLRPRRARRPVRALQQWLGRLVPSLKRESRGRPVKVTLPRSNLLTINSAPQDLKAQRRDSAVPRCPGRPPWRQAAMTIAIVLWPTGGTYAATLATPALIGLGPHLRRRPRSRTGPLASRDQAPAPSSRRAT
jgi:hypothetical protein